MSVRSCRVTVQDLDGISHTAEVTASSLFEAVAQGLAALRKNEWVEGIEELCLSKISKCLSRWGLFLLHNSR